MTPITTAIFEDRLRAFYAEYQRRFGETTSPPGIAVRLSAPGLDEYFNLNIAAEFLPPLTADGRPGE